MALPQEEVDRGHSNGLVNNQPAPAREFWSANNEYLQGKNRVAG
jgi:hypothetical protein